MWKLFQILPQFPLPQVSVLTHQDFFQNSSSAIFLNLSFSNLMQNIRKNWSAISEILHWEQTDGWMDGMNSDKFKEHFVIIDFQLFLNFFIQSLNNMDLLKKYDSKTQPYWLASNNINDHYFRLFLFHKYRKHKKVPGVCHVFYMSM